MALLITGGTGFVGARLYKLLPEDVQETCLLPTRSELNLSDPNSVKKYFDEHEIDRVVHLAASLNNKDTAALFESNISGLYNLLRCSRAKQVRHFVFASTNNVYGTEGSGYYQESDPMSPDLGNNYGISKMYGELAVKACLAGSDAAWTILRFADIYGPRQKTGALLKAVVGNILSEQPQKLYGEGDRTRDYIYLDDIAAGLCFVLEKRLQGVYNLATGIGTNVRQIVAYAEELSPCREETVLVSVEKEDHSCVVLNADKLAAEGFRTKTAFKDGLRKIIEEEKQ